MWLWRIKGTDVIGERWRSRGDWRGRAWGAEGDNSNGVAWRNTWYCCALIRGILVGATEMCYATPGSTLWFFFVLSFPRLFSVIPTIFKYLPVAKPISSGTGTSCLLGAIRKRFPWSAPLSRMHLDPSLVPCLLPLFCPLSLSHYSWPLYLLIQRRLCSFSCLCSPILTISSPFLCG